MVKRFDAATVWLARFYPYTATDLDRYLGTLPGGGDRSRETVGTTALGRPMQLLTVTNPATPPRRPLRQVVRICTKTSGPVISCLDAQTMAASTSSPPRRADARRNIETIIAAAERCLARDPDASMSDIASEAGLGRVTLYAHFKTRAELVEVVARRVLADVNPILDGVDLRGDPAQALARLVTASWEVTARSGSLIVAVERALPPEVVRDAHGGKLEDRVRRFLARGQRERTFRSDLSTDWLVALFHATLHTAATEVHAGRLATSEVAATITATLLAAYRPPPETGSRARQARGRTASR